MNSWLARRAFIMLGGLNVKLAISFSEAIPRFEKVSRVSLRRVPSVPPEWLRTAHRHRFAQQSLRGSHLG